MKRAIWKFPLKITDAQEIEMPASAVPLSVQMQGGVMTLWAMVSTERQTEMRSVYIVGTGNPITGPLALHPEWFVGTVQERVFVWHVFVEPA